MAPRERRPGPTQLRARNPPLGLPFFEASHEDLSVVDVAHEGLAAGEPFGECFVGVRRHGPDKLRQVAKALERNPSAVQTP